jgi:hypothetical protein
LKLHKASLISFLLLFLCAVAAIVWFFIENQDAAKASSALSQERTALSTSEVELIRDKAKMKGIQSNQDMRKMIPKSRDDSNLIREFNIAAGQTSVHIQSITMDTNSGGQTSGSAKSMNSSSNNINTEIIIDGSKTGLLNFIDLLQTNERVGVVTGFDLSEDNSGTHMDAKMEFPYGTQG